MLGLNRVNTDRGINMKQKVQGHRAVTNTFLFWLFYNLGGLDLAVLFTQVRWNTCAGVRQTTPSIKVV